MEKIDITFVIQGAISKKLTKKALESVRKYFTSSTIILSTWEGSEINFSSTLYDKLLLNKDVGNFAFTDKTKNNIDRQITSTINGLREVKTKYAVKMRSDFILYGDNLLNFFDKFDKFEEKYKILNKRVLTSSRGMNNPESKFPYPFHLSDFFFFGLTEDLINLFDIPMTREDEKLWNNTKNVDNISDIDIKENSKYICRFVPEQHIMINFLKKNGVEINCYNFCDNTTENIESTKKYFVNNFVFLSMEQLNFRVPKRTFKTRGEKYYYYYSYFDFLRLYIMYCDSSFRFPEKEYRREFLINNLFHFKKKTIMFLVRIFTFYIPIRNARKYIREFLLNFFHSINFL